jgi:hypothetical protein
MPSGLPQVTGYCGEAREVNRADFIQHLANSPHLGDSRSSLSTVHAVNLPVQPLWKCMNSQCRILATELVLPAIGGTAVVAGCRQY